MSQLLKPHVNLSISLCIPFLYVEELVQHGSTAFNQALEFLVSENVPFHLSVNETKPNRLPSASRHGNNQISSIAFVVVTSESEWVSLDAVV